MFPKSLTQGPECETGRVRGLSHVSALPASHEDEDFRAKTFLRNPPEWFSSTRRLNAGG